jgi:DnaJ-class molecular chaperone
MKAAEHRLALCPNCNGSGDSNRKVEFRRGTVGAWASKATAADECGRCSGEGLIYEPVNLPPPAS